jgi:Mannosyltransferase putative
LETGEAASLASGSTADLELKVSVMSQIPCSIPSKLVDPRCESLPPPPSPAQDFISQLDGIIVLVSAGDVYLAKACCASIRHSMGDIPITLLVDGPNTDTAELQRLPNVKRMVAQEVVDHEYAKLCTGFWVKLLVHWKSPYERFLYLDADTLVWGDLRAYAKFDQFDFIGAYRFTNEIKLKTAEEIHRCLFDVDIVRKWDPALDWHGQELINAGAFFARRGVFARENLMALRRLNCWRCYDNGVLQYLFWRALREGIPRAGGYRLQLFPADETSRPEDRFLPRDGQHPAIIHWITRKPKLGRRYRAADDYRKLFLKMTGRSKWLNARLFVEDLNVWLQRHRRSLDKRLRWNSKVTEKL